MSDLDDLKAKIEALRLKDAPQNADYNDALHQVLALIATHAAEPAPVAVEVPNGAIHNGRAFMDRVEGAYSFECEAGPLSNCSDWHELKRCFEAMAEYIRANLAPTGNTALVEAVMDECAKYITTQYGISALYNTIDRGRILDALSQPAAPQPTPEVEAWMKDCEQGTDTFKDVQQNPALALEMLNRAYVIFAALARGSVDK